MIWTGIVEIFENLLFFEQKGARAAEHYLVDPYEAKGRPALQHASF
jgi:hypothetical protein